MRIYVGILPSTFMLSTKCLMEYLRIQISHPTYRSCKLPHTEIYPIDTRANGIEIRDIESHYAHATLH